ncbi:MAG TPA: glycosyltransferase family 39 protein [Candidatus Brocadiia bacterium]|nr:glycosyltransferase family 39 protein [Candidatus Brocadiia bacterium]
MGGSENISGGGITGKACFWATLLGVLFCWAWLRSDPPWDNLIGEFTDEMQYCANAQYLIKLGQWRVNWLDNSWNSPLFQVAAIASMKTFGPTWLSVRALSACFASGVVIVLAEFVRRRMGAKAAIIAVGLLSSNAIFFSVRKSFAPEIMATFFLSLGYFTLTERGGRSSLVAGIALAAAAATKLSAGYAAPGAFIFVLFCLKSGDWKVRDAVLFTIPWVALGIAAGVGLALEHEAWVAHWKVQSTYFFRSGTPILSRLRELFISCNPLISPTFWVLHAGGAVCLLKFAARRKGGAVTDNEAQLSHSRAELLMLLWTAGIYAASFISFENIERRIIYALVPLTVLNASLISGGIKGLMEGFRGVRSFSKKRKAFLIFGGVLICAYVGLLVGNSALRYFIYFGRCAGDDAASVHALAFPVSVMAALFFFFLILDAAFMQEMITSRFRRFISAGSLAGSALCLCACLYVADAALTVGWRSVHPTYTVAGAVSEVSRLMKPGDCLISSESLDRGAFLLSLDGPAIPILMVEDAPDIPAGCRPRGAVTTYARRTFWMWHDQTPLLEVASKTRRVKVLEFPLIPNPLGVYTFVVKAMIIEDGVPPGECGE